MTDDFWTHWNSIPSVHARVPRAGFDGRRDDREGGSARSVFLACRPEQDFVDVDVVRLAHGECNRPGEGVRWDGLLVGLAHSLRDDWISDAVGQLGCDSTRRDDGGADVVGLDLLPQALRDNTDTMFPVTNDLFAFLTTEPNACPF